MAIIISYDLTGDSISREEVRQTMIELMYQTTVNKLTKTYPLPETTLFNQARTNPKTAINELNKAVRKANKGKEKDQQVKLEKCIASIIEVFDVWPKD